MRIIGYERNDFTVTETGTRISGWNVYIARTIAPARGDGMAVERIYLSERKAQANDIQLEDLINRDVEIFYNRYKKPEHIVAID